MMPKVVLYIACSLDGFIARPDGNIDWLNSLPNPEGIDHGYADFYSSIGATVMGRKTYQEVLGFGVGWPYEGTDSYIVTRDSDFRPSSPGTFPVLKDLPGLVQRLKSNLHKDIWLVGGGQLITSFLNQDLIDRTIITYIPLVIGEGIPLFPGRHKESTWKLIGSQSFSTGAVSLTYER